MLLIVFAKSSVLDVWLESEYVPEVVEALKVILLETYLFNISNYFIQN